MGIRVQDLLDPQTFRRQAGDRAARAQPDPGQGLQPAGAGRGHDLARVRRLRGAAQAADRRHQAAAGQGPGRRRDAAAGGLAGHAARRRPRHLPVRHVVLADRGWRGGRLGDRADPDQPGDRDPQGVHDQGRGGAVPDRAVRRLRRVPAQGRRRGRRDDRAAAPVRLVRLGHRPVRDPRQRAHRPVPHQARRAVRAGPGAGLCRVRGRRGAGRRDADDPGRVGPGHAAVRAPGWLVRAAGGRQDLRRPAAERAGATSAGSRSCPGVRSRPSASAPVGTRPLSCATWSRRSAGQCGDHVPAVGERDPVALQLDAGAGVVPDQLQHPHVDPLVHRRRDRRPRKPNTRASGSLCRVRACRP